MSRASEDAIFVIFGNAVAHGAQGRRQGARHRLLLLIRADSLDSAATRASIVALQYGYQHLTMEKGDRLDITADEAEQDYLKSAISTAEQNGQAIIVYDEELPPNA